MSRQVPPVHGFDLRLLRILKAVVECRGFAAAEETLGIGRSTISKHVSDLETRLGSRLCERGRSGLSLTPYGQGVCQATLELLGTLDHFRAQVSLAKEQLSGSVNLWLVDSTPLEHGNPVAAALEQFKARPGKVEIALHSTDPASVEDAVLTRQANIGITIVNRGLEALTYRPIGQEVTSRYCSSNHPLAVHRDDVEAARAAIDSAERVVRGYLRSDLLPHTFNRRSSTTAFHLDAMVQLLLSDRYIGVLPAHIARPWVASGQLAQIDFPERRNTVDVSVVFRAQSAELPAVAALIDDITDAYQLSQTESIEASR